MKKKPLSVMVSFWVGRVFVLKHSNDLLFQHICKHYGANPCCPFFQPETIFVFCRVQKCENPPGSRPCEAVPLESGFSARSKSVMEAVAEIAVEEHEVCCSGSEIIAATPFPAEIPC